MIPVIALSQLFGLLFARSFLSTRRVIPLFDRILIFYTVFSAIVNFIAVFVPYQYGIRASLITVIITVVLMFSAGLISYLKKYRPSRFFIYAFVTLIFAIILISLRNFNILPFNLVTSYSPQLGMVLMVTLLSLALADRINIMKEEKNALQQQALETQKKMTDSFARFVPNQFLSYLNKHDVTQVELGDSVEKEMTILFTDVRSFTSISEKMAPEESFSFINALLKRIGPVIRSNNGFIDKYLGDAIMALFPESPEDAINAALEMTDQLKAYNVERKEKGKDEVLMGIGIHSGNLMLGIIGESQRMEGTVISDAVNLASRIEGLTKRFNANILISKTAFDRVNKTLYNHRFIATVQVKGKDEKVEVIEILI